MPFDFEKFEGVGGSYAPKISVRSNGTIGVSKGALNRFKLAEGDWFLQLFFDRKNQVIGIQPTNEAGPGLIKLNKKTIAGKNGKESINAFLSAKAFLDYYGINYEETESYMARWDETKKLIIVELNKPRPNPTGGSAGGGGASTGSL